MRAAVQAQRGRAARRVRGLGFASRFSNLELTGLIVPLHHFLWKFISVKCLIRRVKAPYVTTTTAHSAVPQSYWISQVTQGANCPIRSLHIDTRSAQVCLEWDSELKCALRISPLRNFPRTPLEIVIESESSEVML